MKLLCRGRADPNLVSCLSANNERQFLSATKKAEDLPAKLFLRQDYSMTTLSPLCVTNKQFLDLIFGKDVSHVHLAAIPGDPNAEQARGYWRGGRTTGSLATALAATTTSSPRS